VVDRFSAFLLLRRFLRRPPCRELALAIEGIMEELAEHCRPAETATWGVLGLLSQLDLEYSLHNRKAQGATARAQAELEGLDPALARSLEVFRAPRPDGAPAHEDALVLAEVLGRAALGQDDEALELAVEREGDEAPAPPRPRGARFPDALAAELARRLELSSGRGDAAGDRLDAALAGLGLDPARAAALALRALRRVEADLR
jgi:hypothetical protein